MIEVVSRVAAGCPDSEYSVRFLQGMIDRMAVAFHNYGPVEEGKGKVDNLACVHLRLEKYRETGNTEFLIDAANFSMMEFIQKGPKAYRATTAKESPGRVWMPDENDGYVEVSARANDGTPAL